MATTHRPCHLPQNVKEVWPEGEFADTDVTMPDGVHPTMKLAGGETRLGETLTVKEVRRLTTTGHPDCRDQHGSRAGQRPDRRAHVCPLVPGKFLRLHDATL